MKPSVLLPGTSSRPAISLQDLTVSEVKRGSACLVGTKIPAGRDPVTGKIRQVSYVKHTDAEILDAVQRDIPWLMAESRYSLSIRTQYRARLQNADPALLAMPVSEVSQSDAQHHVEWMQHS